MIALPSRSNLTQITKNIRNYSRQLMSLVRSTNEMAIMEGSAFVA